jgi:hypothetical protein
MAGTASASFVMKSDAFQLTELSQKQREAAEAYLMECQIHAALTCGAAARLLAIIVFDPTT